MNKRQQNKTAKLAEEGIKKIEESVQPNPQEKDAILKIIKTSPSHKERLVNAIMNSLKKQVREAAGFEPKR